MTKVYPDGSSPPYTEGGAAPLDDPEVAPWQDIMEAGGHLDSAAPRGDSNGRRFALPADSIPTVPTSRVYRFTKRGMDILGALVGLTVSVPMLAVCALMIKFQDGGPILFSQERVGERGKRFRIHKFRSMVVNADELMGELREYNEHDDDRTFKILNDPRITPAGRLMRRLSLDEFPQFWNVLIGQMSLVGPRPALPSEVALYDANDLKRLSVRPGLTCIWQVSGRSNLDFRQQVELDIRYIENQGLLTDLGLILRTLPAVLDGDGAA